MVFTITFSSLKPPQKMLHWGFHWFFLSFLLTVRIGSFLSRRPISFIKQILLSAFYIPSPVLRAGNKEVNESSKVSVVTDSTFTQNFTHSPAVVCEIFPKVNTTFKEKKKTTFLSQGYFLNFPAIKLKSSHFCLFT